MRKFLHLTLLSAALSLPLIAGDAPTTTAQERQGCFMINAEGRLIDLSPLCPSTTTVVRTQRLGTGDIQVTLRWATTDDLDMAVTDPRGETVAFYNRAVGSRGQLDVDANAGCAGQTPTPIENIFWPPGQAPQGQYKIDVNLFSRCNPGEAPIPFTITLLVQGTTRTLQGTVSDGRATVSFPFSLPVQANQRSPQTPTPQATQR